MDKDEPSNIFISKVKVKESFVYIKLIWTENKIALFQIQIFDADCGSWSGSYSDHSAEKCRKSFACEDKDEYKKNVKLALTGCSDSYVYDLVTYQNEPDTKKIFRWKKVFEDSAIVVHGHVIVQQVTETKNDIIDILLADNRYLRKTIQDCNEKNVEISKDLEKCKTELETCINMKSTLEETLYAKFVQLLNAKKKRIQLLEETLEKQ